MVCVCPDLLVANDDVNVHPRPELFILYLQQNGVVVMKVIWALEQKSPVPLNLFHAQIVEPRR